MPTPVGTQPPGGSYTPLKVGNSWTYDIYTNGTAGTPASTKTVSVADISNVGDTYHAGTSGYRLHTVDATTGPQDEWHVDLGSQIVRERRKDYDPATGLQKTDASYNPSKLYVDQTAAHTALNATWTENYTDITADLTTGTSTTTDHTVNWTVEAVNESVTTPAGTFSCLKLHRLATSTTSTGNSDKYFWFAQGVGKVKEEDVNGSNIIRAEILSASSVSP